MPLRISDPESDDALETLLTAVSPKTDSTGQTFYGQGAIIQGDGPGKKTIVRRLLREMEDSYGTPTLLVDCKEHETAAEIYRALLDEVVDEPSQEYADLSRGALLREVGNTLEKPCVLALDRADHLAEKRILYNAYEKEFLIPVVMVDRRRDLLDGLDESIVSRMSGLWPVRFEA